MLITTGVAQLQFDRARALASTIATTSFALDVVRRTLPVVPDECPMTLPSMPKPLPFLVPDCGVAPNACTGRYDPIAIASAIIKQIAVLLMCTSFFPRRISPLIEFSALPLLFYSHAFHFCLYRTLYYLRYRIRLI